MQFFRLFAFCVLGILTSAVSLKADPVTFRIEKFESRNQTAANSFGPASYGIVFSGVEPLTQLRASISGSASPVVWTNSGVTDYPFTTYSSFVSAYGEGVYNFAADLDFDDSFETPLASMSYGPGSPFVGTRITNFASLSNVDPTQPFTLTWEPIPGASSANGLFNLGSAEFYALLDDEDVSYVIAANTFAPNSSYSITLQHRRTIDLISTPSQSSQMTAASDVTFILQTIPEPSVPLLLLAGICVGGCGRRRAFFPDRR